MANTAKKKKQQPNEKQEWKAYNVRLYRSGYVTVFAPDAQTAKNAAQAAGENDELNDRFTDAWVGEEVEVLKDADEHTYDVIATEDDVDTTEF